VSTSVDSGRVPKHSQEPAAKAVVSGGSTSIAAPALWGWWFDSSPEARRALVAAALGWMLDSFDVMLYALVLAVMMHDLHISAPTAGWLGSIALLSGAAGGIVFGVIADRFGRTRALMASVLIYSVATAACGFAQSIWQLAIFRIILGFGMGGEWASGAALVSETWPDRHRGKALGLMQSAWAIGYAAAAIVTWLVLPRGGWRAVFFVGILPALLILWVRRRVEEPAIWRAARDAEARAEAAAIAANPGATPPNVYDRIGGAIEQMVRVFAGPLWPVTLALTLMNSCTLFAWWGFNLWIPAYLSLPVDEGGIGLSTAAMSGFVVAMQVGMWFGYVTFGYVSDVIGRRRTYVIYLVTAAVMMCTYGLVRDPMVLLALGPFVAFFATGHFSGLGTVTAEIYATDVRATAQGLTYNIGRIASAVAPFAVGSFAKTHGYGAALSIASSAFLLAAVMFLWIPETKGRALER
jgi:putative sialic acid transporter